MAHHTPISQKRKWPVFSVPFNLDLTCFPSEHRDCVAYFLNLIHWKWVNWRANPAGFVPLKRRYIERVIPRSVFVDIRGKLIDMGVVICDDHYRPGSKCLGYRLGHNYRIAKRIVCKDPVLRRRIARLQREAELKLSRVDRYLRDNLLELDFDAEEARRTIERMTPRAGTALNDSEYRILIGESVSRLAGGERDFHRDN